MIRTTPHSDQEYRTIGKTRGNGQGQNAPAEALAGIPTDDPAAALQFCRALAHALAVAPASLAGCFITNCITDSTETTQPELSVVIPVYNEEDNLPRLYERLIAALDPIGLAYEILFVDDGSRDGSLT